MVPDCLYRDNAPELMNNARLDILFERYRSGSCTKEEEIELIDLIAKHDDPQVRMLFTRLWNDPSDKLSHDRAEQILNSILKKPAKVIPLYKRTRVWASAAAITAILVIAAVMSIPLNQPSSGNLVTAETSAVTQQNRFLTLPDGSTVILNSSSKLEYDNAFDDQEFREVYLTGEAFFDIRHNDTKPFIVHTGKVSTTVLGTAFNISAYPEQNDITVTVTRGKVKVSDNTKLLGILTPNKQITIHTKNDQAKLSEVNSKEITTWMEKDIFFDNVSMEEAVQQLRMRFDIRIDLTSEKLKACRFTATFVQGEDLYQILDVICEFNQANYKVNESGVIEISGAGC
jgi:ferric-dicitrate binding protein FerR (iron transport regulator)